MTNVRARQESVKDTEHRKETNTFKRVEYIRVTSGTTRQEPVKNTEHLKETDTSERVEFRERRASEPDKSRLKPQTIAKRQTRLRE
ncbi:hypothetical protein J6590_083496 [Homalodisca vitripennis]|nr:hypothetical protein J6590_083496 [Homalodisca vitripennis]